MIWPEGAYLGCDTSEASSTTRSAPSSSTPMACIPPGAVHADEQRVVREQAQEVECHVWRDVREGCDLAAAGRHAQERPDGEAHDDGAVRTPHARVGAERRLHGGQRRDADDRAAIRRHFQERFGAKVGDPLAVG